MLQTPLVFAWSSTTKFHAVEVHVELVGKQTCSWGSCQARTDALDECCKYVYLLHAFVLIVEVHVKHEQVSCLRFMPPIMASKPKVPAADHDSSVEMPWVREWVVSLCWTVFQFALTQLFWKIRILIFRYNSWLQTTKFISELMYLFIAFRCMFVALAKLVSLDIELSLGSSDHDEHKHWWTYIFLLQYLEKNQLWKCPFLVYNSDTPGAFPGRCNQPSPSNCDLATRRRRREGA